MTLPAVTSPQEVDANLKSLAEAYANMRQEIGKVVIGQNDVVEELLLAIFARGHCVLVGVPGLAKTLLVSTVSRVLNLSYKRIQFTPDLMPADITGTEIIQEDPVTRERKFVFLRGPLFANMILADEINRTPPKTQAALLEAMQEHRVTVGGQSHKLAEPFFVLATQNPIEQEGTYPLPEAQLDRFMFMINVGYPTKNDEVAILKATTGGGHVHLEPKMTGEEILKFQEIVRATAVHDVAIEYAANLVRKTRPNEKEAPGWIRENLAWGAGPRASQYLVLGAKARAALNGSRHATVQDIRNVALPVLRHRIVTNFNAEAEGLTTDKIVSRLLDETPDPTS